MRTPPRRKTPPLLAISMGDPAGVGPEVILKAAATLARRRGAPSIVVVGDLSAMRAAAARLRDVPAPREWRAGEPPIRLTKGLGVLSISNLSARALRPAHPSVEGGGAAHDYIVTGAQMALGGEVDALVTAPISKDWMNRAGHHFPGHSELLAEMSRTRLWRMMFGDEEIRVIAPAIRRANREGIDAYGPLAPDTAFIRKQGSFNFDAAVAMYHDQ